MTNIELVQKAKWIATLPTIYVTGGQGQPLDYTNRQRFLAKRISETQKANIRKADSETFAFDCNGLIKAILWGFNGNLDHYMGGAKYKASEDIPEDRWINLCHPSMDFSKIATGAMVWMTGHVGIYVGNGYVVECTPKWNGGVQYSVCVNHPENATGNGRKWEKWGKLPNVEYLEADEVKKTLKVRINGIIKEVNAIESGNENYIRLRDFDTVLGVCKVDYDAKEKMPTVEAL